MAEVTSKELEMMKEYFKHLNLFRKEKQEIPGDDFLISSSTTWLNIIDKLGDGDPIKAAQNHAMAVIGRNEDMKLSTSDKSEAIH